MVFFGIRNPPDLPSPGLIANPSSVSPAASSHESFRLDVDFFPDERSTFGDLVSFFAFVFASFFGVATFCLGGVLSSSGSAARTCASSAMNSVLCAHPAYAPNTAAMASSTASIILGVKDLPSSSRQ